MWKWMLLCVALVSPVLYAQSQIRPATEAEVTAIKTGSERTLKDAPSAIFRDVSAIDDGEGHAYFCGLVNAKNSYGAYGGFIRFYGTGNMTETPILAGIMFTDDGNPPGMASQMCMSNGFN